MHQTTIATDGDVDALLLEVAITSLRYIDDSRCLTTTDPLLLTSNTDGSTTDPHLDEVGACICEVAEAFFVYYVPCSDEDFVAIALLDPAKGIVLPL